MDISLTPWLWVNLVLFGLLFSIGFTLGGIIINGIIAFIAGQRRPPP